MEKLVFHSQDFHEILYSTIFKKFVEKTQVSLKFDKNNRQLYVKTYVYLWYYIAEFFFEQEMFQSKFVEKITFYVPITIFQNLLPILM